MNTTFAAGAAAPVSNGYRWLQLALGVLCMIMIANLQYGWTLFVSPLEQAQHWSRRDIQIAFTIFVLMQTWLVPVEGWIIDRFGPRLAVAMGGIMVGAAWTLNGLATTLPVLYLAAAIGGVGAGVVYSASVGNALKWFPDKRGLAAGIVAGGFGGGSALTVIPIANTIAAHGYQNAFLWFGLGQGIIVLAAALVLRAPRAGETPAASAAVQAAQSKRDFTPGEVIRTPLFWVMYAMFVLVGAGGLMAVAQLAPMARDFGVANVPVSVLGLTLPALQFALSIDRILNGITRPFFGWVSDHIGRENTMFLAFGLEGIGIWLLATFAQDPVLFVVLSGLVFFAWGEIYSLFPSLCTDVYGRRYATANYGMLYTAKGTAALLVPFSAWLQEATGSWNGVFYVVVAANLLASAMALVVLKPLRNRMARRQADTEHEHLEVPHMAVIAGEASK